MSNQPRKLFVNLPVRDLPRSMEFFRKLGFTFNQQFVDETAACMVISEEGYVMLLTEAKLKELAGDRIADTAFHAPVMIALSASSRADVDQLVETAIANGGRADEEPQDHGFMYQWGFYDLDGHHWEAAYMEPSAMQQ